MPVKYKKFFKYLILRKRQLKAIKSEIYKNPYLKKLFNQKNWFDEVGKQIEIWKGNPKIYSKGRGIVVPEYELFRYFSENSILKNFIRSFFLIEKSLTNNDENQLSQWNSTKSQLFSEQVNQIYSSLFEILVLGKLISTNRKIYVYYKNIDGRILIGRRYIYFEIRSLQKTQHDLEGIGAPSTEADRYQIFRALREKNRQLNRYRNFPTLIFLSLFRLADMTTAGWYIPEYFSTPISQIRVNNRIISGVKLYSWFTIGGESAFYSNQNSINRLTQKELEFINRR